MLIIGLTGSIGMGKSTMADTLRDHGIAVLDADKVVHDLYDGAAVAAIEAAFPGTTKEGKVNRQLLSGALGIDQKKFRTLETIVHPMVRSAQADFLREQHTRGAAMAVLEIPLLFETGGDTRVDIVIVVSASPETQRDRVLQRPGMTDEKLQQLLSRQLPDKEKRARADFVVDTDRELCQSEAQIADIVTQVSGRKGDAFERYWRDYAGS